MNHWINYILSSFALEQTSRRRLELQDVAGSIELSQGCLQFAELPLLAGPSVVSNAYGQHVALAASQTRLMSPHHTR